MNKIKVVKIDGVKFSAIDVPVNVCNTERHLIIPFVLAAKWLVNKNGEKVGMSYLNGLDDEKENLLINYYDKYLLKLAILETYYNRTQQKAIKKVFAKYNKYFSVIESDFLKEIGIKPYGNYGAREVLTKILDGFTVEAKSAWCVEYIEKYFAEKKDYKKEIMNEICKSEIDFLISNLKKSIKEGKDFCVIYISGVKKHTFEELQNIGFVVEKTSRWGVKIYKPKENTNAWNYIFGGNEINKRSASKEGEKNPMWGRTHSEETRKKQSEAAKKRYKKLTTDIQEIEILKDILLNGTKEEQDVLYELIKNHEKKMIIKRKMDEIARIQKEIDELS